jgi:hypothetical protein
MSEQNADYVRSWDGYSTIVGEARLADLEELAVEVMLGIADENRWDAACERLKVDFGADFGAEVMLWLAIRNTEQNDRSA